jgi:hypothetical protein
LKTQQEEEAKAPKTREVKVGEEIVTQEWRGGAWHDVARAGRHKPPSTTVNVGTGKLDTEVGKTVIKQMPELQEKADKSVTNLERIDTMVELLDSGAGGKYGQAKAWAGPYLESLGIRTQGLTNAQLYERLSDTLGGSMRIDIVGPGPVSNYEQELLKKVSGGGSTGTEAARKLLLFYRGKAIRNINRYNETARSLAEESPMSERLYQPIESNLPDPDGIR